MEVQWKDRHRLLLLLFATQNMTVVYREDWHREMLHSSVMEVHWKDRYCEMLCLVVHQLPSCDEENQPIAWNDMSHKSSECHAHNSDIHRDFLQNRTNELDINNPYTNSHGS
jgi:hypothetical protein